MVGGIQASGAFLQNDVFAPEGRQAAHTVAEQGGDPASARLEALIADLVRLVMRAKLRRAMLCEGSDLSATDDWLLRHLAECGSARMSDLATWQAVDRSTMTVQIRRLETAGLVSRATDPRDRRASVVTLTAEGREVHEANRRVGRALLGELIEAWTPEEREGLNDSLELLVASLGRKLAEQAVPEPAS